MPGSIGYFSRFAQVGARILRAAAGAPPASVDATYLELLARIYEMLAEIHRGVLEIVAAAGQARSLNEARGWLDQLSQMSIRDTLHARDLCNELGRQGRELRDYVTGHPGLSQEEKDAWNDLGRELELRETGAAELYFDKLSDLRVLPHTEESPERLREKIDDIASELVNQRAEFEFLAIKARSILENLATSPIGDR